MTPPDDAPHPGIDDLPHLGDDDVLHLENGSVQVVANLGEHPVPLPPAVHVLAASEPVTRHVPPDATVWFTTGEANTVR